MGVRNLIIPKFNFNIVDGKFQDPDLGVKIEDFFNQLISEISLSRHIIHNTGLDVASYIRNDGPNHALHLNQVGVNGASQNALLIYSATNQTQAVSALQHIYQFHASSVQPTLRITNNGKGYGINLRLMGVLGAGQHGLNVYTNQAQDNANLVRFVDEGSDSAASVLLVQGNNDAGQYVVDFRNVGADATSHGLYIMAGGNGADASAEFIHFARQDGTNCGEIQKAGSTSVSYSTTSDRKVKRDIVDTRYTLKDLMDVKVRDFRFKDDGEQGQLYTGLIAQELDKVYPSPVVKSESERPWGIDYGKLTPLLIKAVQDLSHKVDTLEARIKTLEGR